MITGVIPAYNEESILAESVTSLACTFQHLLADDWEIIIVNDGSIDSTETIAHELSQLHKIKVINHPVNRGKGAAVKSGVMLSSGDLVLVYDADMSTPPVMLGEFIREIESGADLVTGNRRTSASRILKPQPLLRRFMGWVYICLAKAVSGVPLSDFNCGFKLMRGDAARKIFSECRLQRWTWDVEIVMLAVRNGLIVRSVPVVWQQGQRSSVHPFAAAVSSMAELITLFFRFR